MTMIGTSGESVFYNDGVMHSMGALGSQENAPIDNPPDNYYLTVGGELIKKTPDNYQAYSTTEERVFHIPPGTRIPVDGWPVWDEESSITVPQAEPFLTRSGASSTPNVFKVNDTVVGTGNATLAPGAASIATETDKSFIDKGIDFVKEHYFIAGIGVLLGLSALAGGKK